MIDWVDQACKDWGRCTRWMFTATGEGFPHADVIQRAREGRLSADESSLKQHFGEVRTGNALEVARALNTKPYAPEILQTVLWAQYVLKARSKERIEAVEQYLRTELSATDYWRTVDRLHWWLVSRMECSTVEQTVATVETRLAL